ncbi:hypothetical protein NOC27_2416 [Nitrosococcus oceani AFC27]|uniref:Uncharacterized protein n=1 Tax=Nitrosococcus oceani C-27 TaxID=314279 RepID=A0A0E2YY14_9GAMM|nr:hypothetical protein NOC27_2416 [Nitrosococcus oceani AFC27]KFI18099.1 hypothetical protein IB75_16415 [Nitrosococcus oceani C-27]GEM21337.1 hypothetical protein NONS58_27760 [Nitrosococcus oceani]
MQTACIFGQATVANLAIARDLLDVTERIAPPWLNAGFDFLDFSLSPHPVSSSTGAADNEAGNIFTMFIPFL